MWASDDLCQILWPLAPKKLARARRLRIIALGLPRTGTNSLVVALQTLGFHKVYHGFLHVDDPHECVNWLSLWARKQAGECLTAADFDAVLGDCDALTDAPAVLFAEELIKAYPDAKVIVNYREDIEAWHRSVINTWSAAEERSGPAWFMTLLSLFHPRMFWLRIHEERITQSGLFRGSYRKHAKEAYRDHYALLDRIAPKQHTLKWKVQDGWGPLCEFLGKPVPNEPFPNTNALDEVLDRVVKSATKDGISAMIRLVTFVVALVAVGVWYILWW
jgi:hypothetical protein